MYVVHRHTGNYLKAKDIMWHGFQSAPTHHTDWNMFSGGGAKFASNCATIAFVCGVII